MMYTIGIRHIFEDRSRSTLEGVKKLATELRYYALVYNNRIFIRQYEGARDKTVIEPWIKTCFQLTDFQDVQT